MYRHLMTCLLGLAAGCAGGAEEEIDDPYVTFDQIFDVTAHTMNYDACDSDGEEQLGDPYFRLLEDDNGGLQYFTCRTPDDCNEFSDDLMSFPEPKENKWDGSISWTSFAQAESLCTTYMRKSSLKFKDNGNATITRFDCSQTLGVQVFSESECDDMEDESLLCSTGSESCVNYEQVTAKPVEE